jgi:hypothetical protein
MQNRAQAQHGGGALVQRGQGHGAAHGRKFGARPRAKHFPIHRQCRPHEALNFFRSDYFHLNYLVRPRYRGNYADVERYSNETRGAARAGKKHFRSAPTVC